MYRRGVLIVGISNRAVFVVGGAWVEADDVDVPSWKGRRGRLATAKECRRKTLDAISVGRERFLLVMAGVKRSSTCLAQLLHLPNSSVLAIPAPIQPLIIFFVIIGITERISSTCAQCYAAREMPAPSAIRGTAPFTSLRLDLSFLLKDMEVAITDSSQA